MNLRKLISAFIITAAGITMSAQDGSTAYTFLNTTSSARIYGLGGINISNITGDLGSTDQNPGMLGGEMDNQLLVNYMRYLGDSNFAGIRYARAAGEYGAWAVGVQYYGYGSIKGADENGILTGEFSPKDISFSGTYSHDITDRLRGGATLKMIYSGYEEYSAFAVATDLGINYYNDERDLSLSFVVANLGGQVKRFRDTYDRLPFDMRLGWSQSFGSLPVRFSVTAWNLTKWHLPYYDPGDGTTQSEPEKKDSFSSNLFRHLIFGADFTPSDKFYISLAYNYKTRTDMSTYSRSFISGFSLGAGLNVNKFGIGLAFSQPHTGATTFMVNVRLDINDFLF